MENQQSFHKSLARIRLYCGGNGSGKTHAGAAEVAAALTGQRFPWMGRHYAKPPVHFWIVKQKLPDNPRVDPVLSKLLYGEEGYDPHTCEPVLREPLIPARFEPVYNRNANYCILNNGSTFQIKSGEQDTIQFAGASLHGVWADEPPRAGVFEELRHRLTRKVGACMLLTMTPAYGGTSYLDDLLNDKHGVCEHWFVSTRANIWLPPDELQDVINTTPDDIAATRLEGHPAYLSGLLYGGWDNWAAPFTVPGHWTRYVIHDPGINNPAATMWIAVEPETCDLYIYRIDYDTSRSSSIRLLCQRLLRLTGEEPIYKWLIDPFAGTMRPMNLDDPRQEQTVLSMYRECGVPFVKGPRQQELAGKVQRWMKTCLYVDKANKTCPTIYAFDMPSMDPLRKELRLCRWPEKVDDKNQPVQPHDEHNHLIYCMETACALRLKPAMAPIPLATAYKREVDRPLRDVWKGLESPRPSMSIGAG